MSKFIEDVTKDLIDKSSELGIPSQIRLDFLPEDGPAVTVWQQEQSKVLREFINGKKILKGQFKVMAQDKESLKNSTVNLKLVSQLENIGNYYEAMNNFRVSERRKIVECEATTPTINSREDNGMVVYITTIDCVYTED